MAHLLLAMLMSNGNTLRLKEILREQDFQNSKPAHVSVALAKLRTKGLLGRSASGWRITAKGKEKVRAFSLLSYFPSPFKGKDPANTVIAFDIPENSRKSRDWLRNQIKIFGYKMLQQSLWVGPRPLPANFMKRLGDLHIRKNIKTFTIRKNAD